MKAVILFAVFVLVSLHGAAASAAPANCENPAEAAAVSASFEGELEKLKAEFSQRETVRQAGLDAKADKLVKAGAWKPEDRTAFYDTLFSSSEFKGLQAKKQKQAFVYQFDLVTARGMKDSNAKSACAFGHDAIATYTAIGDLNEAEFKLVDAGLDSVAKAKNVTFAK
jgi:hypothetical protein